ncbi:hypothetical protein QE385_001380 [Sphingomonas sp. SORGH_AS 950]|nr:hypothetical protein [Sphingomonas sp. SORGH_AS_0950]
MARFHRELGVADQLLGIAVAIVVGVEGDAHRRLDIHLVIGQPEGRAQRAVDPVGQDMRLVLALVDHHQDAEFIAADPPDRVARPQRPLQPACDGDQQFVPDQRAHTGVQPTEAVEIDDQHRMRMAGRHHRLDQVAESLTIGQSGQAVGRHLAPQAALGMMLGGLVDQHEDILVRAFLRRAGERDLKIPAVDGFAKRQREFDRLAAQALEIADSLRHLGHDQCIGPRLGQTGTSIGGVDRDDAGPIRAHRDFRRRDRHDLDCARRQSRDWARQGSRDWINGRSHLPTIYRPIVKTP